MFNSRILHIICALFLSVGVLAQGEHIRFKRITINEGLSLSSVYCIFQDSKGFMWFGTEDGLNKYDGKNFTIYRTDPANKNSISSKWTEQIYEDQLGKLWFGSRGGLTSFNPKTEIFTQFVYSPSDSLGLTNDTITTIVQNMPNYLWVGTLNGLNRINLQSNKVEHVKKTEKEVKVFKSRVNVLLPDRNGNVWIGTNNGLCFYDLQTDKYSRIIPTLKEDKIKVLSLSLNENELWIGTESGLIKYLIHEKKISPYLILNRNGNPHPDQFIEKVLLDKKGNLWVVTKQGLYKLDQISQTFKLFIKSSDSSNSLAINLGKPLFEDSRGFLWYGTFGAGLYQINPEKGYKYNYRNNLADNQSLSQNSINCIYEDRLGALWFGTFGAGLSIYDPQFHKFNLFRHNPFDTNSLSDNFIWSIFEDSDGSVWIGTNDKGLNQYFPETKIFSFFDYKKSEPASLSNSSVRKVFQDSKGTIWVGTDGGGLSKLDKKTGKFKHFKSIRGDTTTLSNNSVRVIFEDKSGILWIGTREGLNRFDPKTEKFKRYFHSRNNPKSISNNFIYSLIYQDKTRSLWVGTYGGGLNKMDIEKETFTRYLNDPQNHESISDDVAFSMYEDNNGILWVGTNSGLNRFDPVTEKFSRFGIKEGLPNEVIYGILPDKQNNIWLSTNFGVSQFSLSNFSVKNFDVNDGLQSNEFNGGAFHRGESGNLYFGGVYGLNIINPEKINPAENISETAITKLEILGKKVQVGSLLEQYKSGNQKNKVVEKNGNFYLPENISFAKEIVLDYKHRFFSLEFSVINNLLPEKINYAYMMDKLDKDWIYSGNRNYVSYANMESGTYTFNVKAGNPDNIWSNTPAQLKIIIMPPFWKTWWFVLFEIMLALVLIIFTYRILLKVRTAKLLKIQNAEITIAHNKLLESERELKELNATKDKFFSIISHDLKNPFTSLFSISELILESYDDINENERLMGLQKIHGSAKQIFNLLENLLTWSKSQTKREKFEPVNFNLLKVIDENIELHKIPAEKKGVKLSLHTIKNVSAFGDREMINTVVRNLINNAIKFTYKGGTIQVVIKGKGSFLEILVKDEGVGISEENLPKLFQIDKKHKTEGTSGEKGTGLGLILCKEFVEKNGGEISVESVINKGSSFRFSVPKSVK